MNLRMFKLCSLFVKVTVMEIRNWLNIYAVIYTMLFMNDVSWHIMYGNQHLQVQQTNSSTYMYMPPTVTLSKLFGSGTFG